MPFTVSHDILCNGDIIEEIVRGLNYLQITSQRSNEYSRMKPCPHIIMALYSFQMREGFR